MTDVLWIDPAAISFKISPHDDLRAIEGGNWDRERCYPLADAIKHRSIAERYGSGARWEDTTLFAVYRRRFAAGEQIRGADTIEELAAQYYRRVDALFADLSRRGFRPDAGPLPVILIGRDGETFIGNQGNHRLAMAKAIGLDRFAGRVVCRHAEAPPA